MKTLALLLALAPFVTNGAGFCFTNTTFYKAHARATYQFLLPTACTSYTDTETNPIDFDGATCFDVNCDRTTATHLIVTLPTAPTKKPSLLGVMTWRNAATGATNIFFLFMPINQAVAEFELRADPVQCAQSMLSWALCPIDVSRPTKRLTDQEQQ